MTNSYVELHSASAFSFLQGASQPEKLVERAVEIGMPAMALLDHNGVYGSARFHTSAKRNNIRAHLGAEIAVPNLGTRLTPLWNVSRIIRSRLGSAWAMRKVFGDMLQKRLSVRATRVDSVPSKMSPYVPRS